MTATISAVELEDLFREINAENVDFHDEPPHVWVSALVSPGGRRRVHLGKIWRFLRRASICKTAIGSDSFQEVPKAPAITYLPATTDRAS
jgi:hypothetical protein